MIENPSPLPARSKHHRRSVSADLSVIKTCVRGLDKSTSSKMLRANLEFLMDRYLWHPASDLPEHLREEP